MSVMYLSVDKNHTYSFWGVHHRPLGGTSPTFGGYITDLWGVHHRPLGGTSPTFFLIKILKIK
jgi:hypothetical protein